VLLEGVFVEELDPTERDGGGGAGHLLLVSEVEEVLAQVLLAQPIGAGVEVGGKVANRGDVALLGSGGEPPQLHVLDHPLA
jgi:hypothetical protein